MMSRLVRVIQSQDDLRDQALEGLISELSAKELLSEASSLDRFRRESTNLYERVRALLFLHAIHRFFLPVDRDYAQTGSIPYDGYESLLERKFERAIDTWLQEMTRNGPNGPLSSALAEAYHCLAFQTLADQVRQSVRSAEGNAWMFDRGESDNRLQLAKELHPPKGQPHGPWLREKTPVRLDLSHSCWSDIFFLGMDFPSGARVMNISVDLAVRGKAGVPSPPIETFLRVINEPVLKLSSIDLACSAMIENVQDVFDFAKDYLGLIKAAIIAAGIIPPSSETQFREDRDTRCAEILEKLCGPGRGLEIVSSVANIPKGSRLAVSTNLLASLIALCMRASRQTQNLEGPLSDQERRVVVGRAILGEWLGGSGGGWQDSGGLWPSLKVIRGQEAKPGDHEYGISRGCLLPTHEILPWARSLDKLRESLILMHGGMAQNVGPILEMVTEKYLLRTADAWNSRQEAIFLFEQLLEALEMGNIQRVAQLTDSNFSGPIQGIIPWATNLFTETLIERARLRFGKGFWGFLMLGGMSGGGMGFFIDPNVKGAKEALQQMALETKKSLEVALPFAMDPVVYDFSINDQGSTADFDCDSPKGLDSLWTSKRTEGLEAGSDLSEPLDASLRRLGFDASLHESIRRDLRDGRLGLAKNRLSLDVSFEDVRDNDVSYLIGDPDPDLIAMGRSVLSRGEVAVVTLAAGSGSRWTQGAGVVKALNPFCKLRGSHRRFIDVHLAKTRQTQRKQQCRIPHIITTSHLTHEPLREYLASQDLGSVDAILSQGQSIGLRMIPGVRDLQFLWNERAQQVLDEQAQKIRESLQAALIRWVNDQGEWSDYRDNIPEQCLHPVGHWFEIPNLLRNGVLKETLELNPHLNYLLLHNIDTVGAHLDPSLLAHHIRGGSDLTFEVIPKHIEDHGGGLARVDGQVQLVEGLAMPREEDEFRLRFYNSMTTWITIDGLLRAFGLSRNDLAHQNRVEEAVRQFAIKMPTYVTIKEVKKRWGHGQEDVFPVLQFEKLWGDMTAQPGVDSRFVAVNRRRGQQLKDPAQLDCWHRDGSSVWVQSLCDWS